MSYKPADPLKRLLAYILDEITQNMLVIAILWPLELLGYGPVEMLSIVLNNLFQAPMIPQELVILIVIFITIELMMAFICWVIIPALMNGQTIGKKLVGLQIRRLMPDGSSEPTEGMYRTHVLRWLGVILWIIIPVLLIDGILVLITEKRQRIGDIFAGTIVVD